MNEEFYLQSTLPPGTALPLPPPYTLSHTQKQSAPSKFFVLLFARCFFLPASTPPLPLCCFCFHFHSVKDEAGGGAGGAGCSGEWLNEIALI